MVRTWRVIALRRAVVDHKRVLFALAALNLPVITISSLGGHVRDLRLWNYLFATFSRVKGGYLSILLLILVIPKATSWLRHIIGVGPTSLHQPHQRRRLNFGIRR